jgi:hypothetical protein
MAAGPAERLCNTPRSRLDLSAGRNQVDPSPVRGRRFLSAPAREPVIVHGSTPWPKPQLDDPLGRGCGLSTAIADKLPFRVFEEACLAGERRLDHGLDRIAKLRPHLAKRTAEGPRTLVAKHGSIDLVVDDGAFGSPHQEHRKRRADDQALVKAARTRGETRRAVRRAASGQRPRRPARGPRAKTAWRSGQRPRRRWRGPGPAGPWRTWSARSTGP